MPMSLGFKQRLLPLLPQIAAHYGTPFHIYDEVGIKERCRELIEAFSNVTDFKEYFAVKALPNPSILSLISEMGCGFDCSSIPELHLARQSGAASSDIMFTSNNTSSAELEVAFADGGCILNLDDISMLNRLPHKPDLISFRYNPGDRRVGNSIIGQPIESKFGITHHQIEVAYRAAHEAGISRFGLHTMIISNERNHNYMVQTVEMLLEIAQELSSDLGIKLEFINMGGGLGIPYHPEDFPLDLKSMADAITEQLHTFCQTNGFEPRLYLESGRYITGPSGVLVTTVINRKNTYRQYVGVDASMSSLMRPAMYGAYHHIEVFEKTEADEQECVDIVGSLCENNDKFAIQRQIPATIVGDLIIIHDTGAHGHAMGFNYNGRLRPKELLLKPDGTVSLIRRQETTEDYFATLSFKPDQFHPIPADNITMTQNDTT